MSYPKDHSILIFLFSMEDIHPVDCLCIVDSPEAHLSCLEVLVPEDDLWDNLQGDTVPACIGCGVPSVVTPSEAKHLSVEVYY